MKKHAAIAILALGLAGRLCAAGETPPAPGDVATLETLVSRWIGLRAEISSEERAWRETRDSWNEELALLDAEKASLDATIAQVSAAAAPQQQEQAALLERRRTLESTLQSLAPLLDRAEDRLRTWERRIPAPLAGPTAQAFRELPRSADEASRLGVPRRLQLVVTLYAQIETLQRGVVLTREVLATTGQQRQEVDVLYLGLAQAFAVTPDGTWAAAGRPLADGGWQWTADPALAPEARRAMAVFKREQTAALVSLPLQVGDAGKGN